MRTKTNVSTVPMNLIFPQVISEILWVMMLLLGSFSVKFLKDLLRSLSVLNRLMEKICERITNLENKVKELENEI